MLRLGCGMWMGKEGGLISMQYIITEEGGLSSLEVPVDGELLYILGFS